MAKSHLFIILIITVTSCGTSKNLSDEVFHSIIGQNEMKIYSTLGAPTRIIPSSGGGKILMYEFYSKGMYLTPYKSNFKLAQTDVNGVRTGPTFTSNVNTATNDPKYTIYANNVSSLKVYLNKNGICIKCEQNLPNEQLEIYHERFKHFKD